MFGLQWTWDSNGLVATVASYVAESSSSIFDVRYAPLSGEVATLAHIEPNFNDHVFVHDACISHDRKLIVFSGHKKALIWDIATDRPRAPHFSFSKPSATSDRWLGIEKDAKQLVITNENFEVVKRFNETMPNYSFGLRIDWSPDERFIIWRNQIGFDYFSNWEGFWMDLHSGQKRVLEGTYIDEQFTFTGNGGEFFRSGTTGVKSKLWSGDIAIGTHLTMIPGDATSAPKDIWKYEINRDEKKPAHSQTVLLVSCQSTLIRPADFLPCTSRVRPVRSPVGSGI